MRVNGDVIPTLEVFPNMMTVPDCMVKGANKIGRGHGEAKLYIASKSEMYSFYGNAGFVAKCFMLKKDLVDYMYAIKNEYYQPSQNYTKKDSFKTLWNERLSMINTLNDIIYFDVFDQYQIAGDRGYVNSSSRGYNIIREIALPLVSYIYVEKLGDPCNPIYYWKLFVDFETIWKKQNGPLVLNYGKGKNSKENIKKEKRALIYNDNIKKARDGQGKYREKLLEQCRICPISKISDERLLIASHIKPWAASNDKEKVDPYNGYMLSPLYDKLFDRGFITFTREKYIILSQFISPFTWKQIGLKSNTYIQALPMDEKREKYLEFHQKSVFKGTIE